MNVLAMPEILVRRAAAISNRMSHRVQTFIFAVAWLVACSHGQRSAAPSPTADPAAQVPTLVLTETQAGSPAFGEAGDQVEVRLTEPRRTSDLWRLAGQQGNVLTLVGEHMEAGRPGVEPAGPYHVFRFSTRGAGRAELVFVRDGRSLRFALEIR